MVNLHKSKATPLLPGRLCSESLAMEPLPARAWTRAGNPRKGREQMGRTPAAPTIVWLLSTGTKRSLENPEGGGSCSLATSVWPENGGHGSEVEVARLRRC